MVEKYKYPKVLTIAGSDSGGAAGIQADIKTISALGCYGMTVITALTAQNTLGVQGVLSISPEFVVQQLDSVFSDIKPDAIKIGMIFSSELAVAVSNYLKDYKEIPIVFDPVMVATSGDILIEAETIQTITKELFPMASIITPNMDEGAILAHMPVHQVADMKIAAKKIMDLGCQNVIVKGGHLKDSELTSVLLDSKYNITEFQHQKIDTKNINGAGCTFSSAIASYLALGNSLYESVELAQEYIYQAILQSQNTQTGQGNGPLNHFFNPSKMIKRNL
ncbi:MAG TPA: bifunctional hydroxymethylpyrimidine kinase/phosphomethylpyrimidine kinase [Chitinophagales bacterium]|nr:bifunctional hydroxymethylpyrimidine kinase/phosphomethylpyrimidine kinase [Chitinophagales bacterium]